MARETFSFEGKRYDITAKTEKELQKKIAVKKLELEAGTTRITKETTVKKWADEWLETYKAPRIGDAALYAYKNRLNKHIYPQIGSMKLKDVKPIHLQKILNNATGNSRDHLKKIRYTLEQIFSSAVSNQLLQKSPAENLSLPSCTSGTRRAITDTERKYILQVAETHTSGLWIKTMLYCGLRPAETAALQGRHINFKNKTLKVENALKRHTNTIGCTKSDSGERLIPLPDVLIPELLALKIEPYEYVFKNQNGNHMSAGGMRKRWESFKREMNIAMGCKTFRNAIVPPFRVANDLVPYCLRHTYCTDLQSAGVPINVAKELMGHSDISITSKIYTHHSEKAFANAAEAINNFHCGSTCVSALSNR